MMNNFGGLKITTYLFLHYLSVFADIAVTITTRMSTILYKYIAIFIDYPPTHPTPISFAAMSNNMKRLMGNIVVFNILANASTICANRSRNIRQRRTIGNHLANKNIILFTG